MLQKIFNIKKLFQGNKSTVQIPMNTLYGSKCLFYVTNLALICIVIMLSIVSVSIYFFMPVVDVSELSKKVNIQEAEEALPVVEPVDVESFDVEGKKVDAYAVIAKKNVFSPQRKEWVVKAVVPKLAKKKKLVRKKVRGIKPKKIVLHGIIMAGDMRKALISNPLTGVSKKKTLYVEEGEEIEGYKVISIESDQIRLDWQGEEIIVTIYSGLIDNKQTDNTGKVNKRRSSKVEHKYKEVGDQHAEVDTDEVNAKTDDLLTEISDEMPISLMSMGPEHFFMPVINAAKLSEEGTSKVEYKYMEVEDQHAEVDTDEVNAKTDDLLTEISDEMPISLMSMGLEHFFMPVINAAKLSEEVEIQDVAETFPYIEFINVGSSEEEQKIVKAEIPKSVDLAAEEELKQKALSEKTIKIVLYGIVIAGDIKKALISNPLTGASNKKTLYVEEGDGLEGYKVTSIEPDQLRLDWQGEEMVVTFPPL